MKRFTRRQFAKSSLAAAAMPLTEPWSPGAFAQAAASADPLWFVDPELRPAAREAQATGGAAPEFSTEALKDFRQLMAAATQPPLGDVSVAKRELSVGDGQPDVTAYVINAKPNTRRPGIVHMHGGGFVVGTALSAVPALQEIARTLDCAIVTVDYRLAPETTYAGSIEDNYAVLRWLARNGAEVGVDPARIAVMGESSGGGHAALLAIAARDRGEVAVAFQLLVYPMLDDRTGSTRQVAAPIGTIGWTAEANGFGWRSFLGEDPGGSSVPEAAVPARVADVAGLPPAFIGVGSIDLFFEEDVVYASRLLAANVPTDLVIVPGAFHGFDVSAAGTQVARNFNAGKIDALKRAFARTAR